MSDHAAILAAAIPADAGDHGPIAVPSDAVRSTLVELLERRPTRHPGRRSVTVHRDVDGTAICRALGIDIENLVGVNIRLRAGHLPTVTARYVVWPPDPDAEELAGITKRYQLTPVPE